jgi:hypothetical protein
MNNTLIPLIEIQPSQCPKFERCNAPLCPLDPDWRQRGFFKGEAICFYMLEAQKPRARCKFMGAIEGQIYRAICIVVNDMKCVYGPLRKRLERAKRTRSRMGAVL